MFTYFGKLIRVIDGDTYDVEIDLGFSISIVHRVRLLEIDCFETSLRKGTTEEEKTIGLAAKDFVKGLFEKDNNIIIETTKSDLYGRYLATIKYKNESGEFINDLATILKVNEFNKK